MGRIRGFTCNTCHHWVTTREMAGMSLERQKAEICFDCEPVDKPEIWIDKENDAENTR